jgi:2-iminobutanoate/2-iminopropanoate deaminase
MGTRIGSLIFSSRIVGTDTKSGVMPEAPAEQARLAFQNVQTLLSQAGSDLSNLVQVTAFVPDARIRKIVESAFAERFPKGSAAPSLSVLQVDLPAGATVRLEIIASIPD